MKSLTPFGRRPTQRPQSTASTRRFSKLRRTLDAEYKDGSSPHYILSSADAISLNERLVRFDWIELLRQSGALQSPNPKTSDDYAQVVADIVRGESLSESPYEHWSVGPRRRVHDE